MGAWQALQKHSNIFNLLLSPIINIFDDAFRAIIKRRDHIDIIRRIIHGLTVTGAFATGALLFFFVPDYQDWIRSFVEPLDLPKILESISAFYLATNGLAYFTDWGVSLITTLTLRKTLGDSEYYLTSSEKERLIDNYTILNGETLAYVVIDATVKNCINNIRGSSNKRTVSIYKTAFNQLKKGNYVTYALLIIFYANSQQDDFKKANNTLQATEEIDTNIPNPFESKVLDNSTIVPDETDANDKMEEMKEMGEMGEMEVEVEVEVEVEHQIPDFTAIDINNLDKDINMLKLYTEKAQILQAKLKAGKFNADEKILASRAITQIVDGIATCQNKLWAQ